jgi:hypothetical protein
MRKPAVIQVLFVLLILLASSELPAQNVIPSASMTSVPAGAPSMTTITYLFTSVGPAPWTSASGDFLVGGTVVATNPTPLNVIFPSGSGTATEVLQIPVRVIQATLGRGTNTFSYRRVISGPAFPITATLTFTVTTSAASSFAITRISLYFDNRRGEVTIGRNDSRLRAFADISFQGTGLLQGYWEVDGRIISQVTRYLTYGSVVTLETPRIPPLPTFDTGTHILRFVITNPVVDIGLPQAIYYITATDAPVKPVEILPARPVQGAVLSDPYEFSWSEIDKKAVYLVEFYDDPSSTPLFSAYSKVSSYRLPAAVLTNTFRPGKTYFWKVKGFDEANRIVGESAIREFLIP